MRILSWNLNGLRAALKKGFMDWFIQESPDMLCLQETKASIDQLPNELREIEGYEVYYCSALRKGYSGVALYSKLKPKSVEFGIGIERYDEEGRIIIADYDRFLLYDIYFPNGRMSEERLQFKLDFYDAFLKHIDEKRASGRSIIICGDVNTAHKEIDLSRPKENEDISGFLLIERQWIDTLLSHGYVDTFRIFEKGGGFYTWWDVKSRARERNVGWRLDYFFVSNDLEKNVRASFMLPEVYGSDHCPVGIDIKV